MHNDNHIQLDSSSMGKPQPTEWLSLWRLCSQSSAVHGKLPAYNKVDFGPQHSGGYVQSKRGNEWLPGLHIM